MHTVPEDAPPRPGRVRRLVRHPFQMSSRWVASRLSRPFYRHREAAIRQLLFGQSEPDTVPIYRTVTRATLHQDAVLDEIRAFAPDLIITSCAPLLQPSLFRLPGVGTLNVHWGVAPAYRGEHTLFWALRRRDPDGLGVTLHWIDAGIDTGPIVARGFPELQGNESEAEIWASSAVLAGRMLASFLLNPPNGVAGRLQAERGTLYRHRDRTLFRELGLALRTGLGLGRMSPRPERIEWWLP